MVWSYWYADNVVAVVCLWWSAALRSEIIMCTHTELQLENTRNRFLLEMFALVLAGATIKACDSKLITPLLIQLYANKNIISKALAPKLCLYYIVVGGPSLYIIFTSNCKLSLGCLLSVHLVIPQGYLHLSVDLPTYDLSVSFHYNWAALHCLYVSLCLSESFATFW